MSGPVTLPASRTRRPMIGAYEVVGRPLGRGGMSTVFRARDPSGRTVALKELAGGCAADRQLARRFRQEYEILAGLSHPHIVRVYGLFEAGGTLVIAMEDLGGASLREVLRASRKVPPGIAVAVASRIALALGHAHERGIVHRDVKPSNILVTGAGDVKLADFGVARTPQGTTTRTGALLGTPAYLAPEQLAGVRDLTPAADLYSLGVVLFEMLTGRPPFPRSQGDIVRMIEHRSSPPTARAGAIGDPRLRELVLACLASDPRDRPASASHLARILSAMEPPRFAATLAVLVQAALLDRRARRPIGPDGPSIVPSSLLSGLSVLVTVLILLSALVYAPQVARRVGQVFEPTVVASSRPGVPP